MKKSSKPCYKCGGNVKMQQGGSAEQDQIMQVIQMFAEMQGVDPEEIIEQLQGLPPEEQQQAIQQMVQAVQQGQGQQMRMGGRSGRFDAKYQDGGSSEQDQVMQIIQMFAEIQGIDPQEIMQRLQQLSPEQQQQAIQQMAQVVQEAMQQQQGMQQQGMPQQGMQQQMMPPEQQAMMAEGGSWYYGGYMNHPMMEPNGYQHSVVLHRMGGSAGNTYADGGGIKIDPRKQGTFKAQASKMGMSVQEAASHILRNKDKYSPTMIKKANFARSFAKEFGGQLDEQDLMELY